MFRLTGSLFSVICFCPPTNGLHPASNGSSVVSMFVATKKDPTKRPHSTPHGSLQQDEVNRKLDRLNQKNAERQGQEAVAEDAKKRILEQKKEEIARHFEEQAATAQQLIQQQALLAQQQQVEQLRGIVLDLLALMWPRTATKSWKEAPKDCPQGEGHSR